MRAFRLLVFLFSVSLAAQPLREVTTVEVVEVPVYVTRGGDPVTGLTREHFRLFVNSQPQSIDCFDVVDFAGLPPEATANPRQRRLYFLLFDLGSDVFAITRARAAVDQFVQQAGPADTFAVGTLGKGGLNVIAPFTRDHCVIRLAVRSLRAETRDPLRIAVSPEIELTALPSPRFDEEEDPNIGSEIEAMMKELAEEPQRRDLADSFGTLDRLAREIAALEGHKHVVLFSTGFNPTVILGGKRDKAMANVNQGPMMNMTSLITENMITPPAGAPKASSHLLKVLERLNARYASASVFLDAIDIAGLRSTWGDGDKAALYLVARSGEVIANRNDLGQAMRDLTDMQRVVYVLGFHARDARRQNSIRVDLVNVPGRPHISHRRSFSSVSEASPSALLFADIVSNDIPQNELSVQLSVDTTKPGSATLMMTVPGRELLAFGNRQVHAKALLYVFSGLRAVAFQGKEIEIDTARAQALEELDLRHSFDLPPGKYTAKVLLRIDDADVRGFARTSFTVE